MAQEPFLEPSETGVWGNAPGYLAKCQDHAKDCILKKTTPGHEMIRALVDVLFVVLFYLPSSARASLTALVNWAANAVSSSHF